jgi:hypothetical protein
MKAVDGGGSLLTRAKIVLVLRGSGWISGNPPVGAVQSVLNAVLASPYAFHLIQYRGIRRPEITDTITDTTDFGSLGPDPRGFLDTDVWRVSDGDIQNAVKSAMEKRPPQDGEDTYYFVIFSRDPLPVYSDPPGLQNEGYHSQFDNNGRKITYGTLLNWSANTLDNIWNSTGSLPAVFAHEVVEACTDPATGFRLDNGEELADLDDVRTVQLPGIQQKISLAAYWSELSGMAVVPMAYSLRIGLDLKASDSAFFEGPQSSTRATLLEKSNP